MIRKILALLLIIVGNYCFADEIYGDTKNNVIIRVGIKSLTSNIIYMKSNGGSTFFKYGENVDEIKENQVIKMECKGSQITYMGQKVDEILTARGSVASIGAISKDGKNFRTYRGDFKFIAKDDKILPINNVYLEEYLCGVIPGEIGITFPSEAIKAQILAARTYAFTEVQNKLKEKYDVADTTDSQMYLGFGAENRRINELVLETEGEVIVYNGKTITAYYYSSSGGETANIEDVWKSNPVPYLKSVNDSNYIEVSSKKEWNYKITVENLKTIMGENIEDIYIAEKKGERVYKLLFITENGNIILLEGNDIRKKIGYNKLLSTIFEITKDENSFLFKGKGSGHGVGMSQSGAAVMAKKGKKYDEILKFYYTGVNIINLEKM